MVIRDNDQILRVGSHDNGCVGGFYKLPGKLGIYGISNNHVIANFNECNVDDLIYPAAANSHSIGELKLWFSIFPYGLNYPDIAFFKIDETKAQIQWSKKPSGFVWPHKNQYVCLNNRKSKSLGIVTGIQLTKQIALRDSLYKFDYMFEIVSIDNTNFSNPGDSGSLICAEYSNGKTYAVGILVGGTIGDQGIQKSYAVPFRGGIFEHLLCEIA